MSGFLLCNVSIQKESRRWVEGGIRSRDTQSGLQQQHNEWNSLVSNSYKSTIYVNGKQNFFQRVHCFSQLPGSHRKSKFPKAKIPSGVPPRAPVTKLKQCQMMLLLNTSEHVRNNDAMNIQEYTAKQVLLNCTQQKSARDKRKEPWLAAQRSKGPDFSFMPGSYCMTIKMYLKVKPLFFIILVGKVQSFCQVSPAVLVTCFGDTCLRWELPSVSEILCSFLQYFWDRN